MNTEYFDKTELSAFQFITENLEAKKSIDEIINALRVIILAQHPIEKQIKFIHIVAQYVLEQAEEHFRTCTQPKRCEEASNWRDLLFFINEMQAEFSIGLTNDEVFAEEERQNISEQVELFIKKYKSDETIYLINEIKEMENLWFLGKKNWNYLLLGKALSLKNDGWIDEGCFNEILNLKKD